MSTKTHDKIDQYTKLLDEFADLTEDAGPVASWSGETLVRGQELRTHIQTMQAELDLEPIVIDTYMTQCDIDDEELVEFLSEKPASD